MYGPGRETPDHDLFSFGWRCPSPLTLSVISSARAPDGRVFTSTAHARLTSTPPSVLSSFHPPSLPVCLVWAACLPSFMVSYACVHAWPMLNCKDSGCVYTAFSLQRDGLESITHRQYGNPPTARIARVCLCRHLYPGFFTSRASGNREPAPVALEIMMGVIR